jgi:hypothetical protein
MSSSSVSSDNLRNIHWTERVTNPVICVGLCYIGYHTAVKTMEYALHYLRWGTQWGFFLFLICEGINLVAARNIMLTAGDYAVKSWYVWTHTKIDRAIPFLRKSVNKQQI